MRTAGLRVVLPAVVLLGAAIAQPPTAQPPTAQPPTAVMWRDPGDVARIDFAGDVGTGIAPPKAPFKLIKEDLSGTQPKVLLRDAAGRTWNAKFGFEVKPECFTWRIPAAVGYMMEPSYYVTSGQIQGLTSMHRKTPSVQADGHFKDARFQVRDPNFKYLEGQTWKWTANPFAGTKELKGLEILIMLASNWDNKDGTSGPGESNTGIFQRIVNGRKQRVYTFTDWGSGMGYWGDKTGQTDWNCHDYTMQTADFVKGVMNGEVVFGYEGHHNDDFKRHIRTVDVAWLMIRLGRITDAQIGAALRANGATPQDETCFTKAIRARIGQLSAVAQKNK